MTFYNSVNIFNNIGSSIPISRIGFRSGQQTYAPSNLPKQDSFSTNPLYSNFGTKAEIESIAKTNPDLMHILKENGIPLNVNIEELNKLKQGHLQNSRILAAKMYSNMPDSLKKEINLSDLQEAAMLHDYGKALIPKEILNKTSVLNPAEKQIMDLHSELGYELLKTKGVRPSVLNLVKYHHQTPDGKGYPSTDKNFEYTTEMAMLAAADKYSALTENRSYKSAMPREEALNIIQQDVDSGQLSQEVYDALKKST